MVSTTEIETKGSRDTVRGAILLQEILSALSSTPYAKTQGIVHLDDLIKFLSASAPDNLKKFLSEIPAAKDAAQSVYQSALQAALGTDKAPPAGRTLKSIFKDITLPKLPPQPINPQTHAIPFLTPQGPWAIFDHAALDGYRSRVYHPAELFPAPGAPDEADNLIAKFLADWKSISVDDSTRWLNRTLALTLRYLWCFSASADLPTISFYDRVKIVLAVSSALNLSNSAPGTGHPALLLTGGDISGIQAYLFNISDPAGTHIAERLRARSFYLAKITDLYLYRLLDQLDLPTCNVIFNGGGRFIVLLPNTKEVNSYLHDTQIAVNLDMLRQTIGDLSFNLGVLPVDSADLTPQSFPRALTRLHAHVEREKTQRFRSLLRSDKGWQPENFVVTDEMYKKYEKGLCSYCEKLPVEKEGGNDCAACYNDGKNGERLLQTNRVMYQRGDGDLYLFDSIESRVSIRLMSEKNPEGVVLNPTPDEPLGAYDGFVYMNNYVPMASEQICAACPQAGRNACACLATLRANPNIQYALPTECLTKLGYARHFADPAGPRSYPYLGYFKADVDRLGTLFSSGFRAGGGITGYATLSRLIDTFFGGYTREMQLRGAVRFGAYEVDLSKIYTVYAGGDDLLFVGAWDSVILFGYLLYLEFRRFGCFNPNVTLSAGIEVTSPKTPVSTATEIAEEHLESAKNSGRNSLSVFGSTFSWEMFPALFHYAQFFDLELKRNKRNERGARISNYVLSRLGQYARQAESFYSGKDATGVIFVSRLMRDITNSIAQKDFRGNITNPECVEPIKYLLQNRDLLRKLSFPLRWALLQNRKPWE